LLTNEAGVGPRRNNELYVQRHGEAGPAAADLPDGDDGSVGWRRRIPDFKSQSLKGAGIGDKGGKKDKEKNKQPSSSR